MSAVLTSYQMTKLTKTFAKLDTDNSGSIDAKELKRGLIEMHQRPNEAELRQILKTVSRDGNDTINLREFTQIVESQVSRSRVTSNQGSEIRSAFKALSGSADCSGTVNIERAQQVIDRFGLDVRIVDLVKHNSRAALTELTYDQFRDALASN